MALIVMTVEWLLDLVIGLLILSLAGAALYTPTLRNCLSLFLAFGIVVTLAWARLGAPDLALAEAAIGAGLTGALLFNALVCIPEDPPERLSGPMAGLSTLFCVLVFILIFQVIAAGAGHAPELPDRVLQTMPDSGVNHPVTAVLLNFRSWDTYLELAVLLVALLGARNVLRPNLALAPSWTVLRVWSKSLAPLLVIVGGYILWRGADAPGGAFQAGALLSAGAVLLRLNNVLPPLRLSSFWVQLAILAGLIVFTMVAVLTMFFGNGWLHYPVDFRKTFILLIEIPATLSIASALTLLVVGEKEEFHS